MNLTELALARFRPTSLRRVHEILGGCVLYSKHICGLGMPRYIVERTLSWFSDFRRLKLC
jgi:hypothetical protein